MAVQLIRVGIRFNGNHERDFLFEGDTNEQAVDYLKLWLKRHHENICQLPNVPNVIVENSCRIIDSIDSWAVDIDQSNGIVVIGGQYPEMDYFQIVSTEEIFS